MRCGSATVSVVLSMALSSANAAPVSVDADGYSVGTPLTSAFPNVTLSMAGRPAQTVVAQHGFSPFNSRNLATTGANVFGYTPVLPPLNSGKVWDEDVYGLLRIDFAQPVSYVQIDLIFDDDDVAGLWAYDSGGVLLDSVSASGDGRGPTPFVTAEISRTTPEIAYVLAGGEDREGMFLDNLQYDIEPAPIQVDIDIKPDTDPNCLNINDRGVIPVAVFGEADFDVADIDRDSLLLSGLEVRARGNRGRLCSLEYVNGDGYLDLVCQFEDNSGAWSPENGEALLMGQLADGTEFEGADSICVEP